ncbi:4Fe-4S binding protein [Alistipes communis]|mgnify:FL=1|uniref:4Fe-4S binding protein n=3 Tax=Alistipes communis TaxID=2585118 RepID=UPI001D065ABD|nr:4Fe-4S binding protein [Alistipes communis]MCB6996595.1 4Fe-4S binding protein [Alistipes communis]
MKPAKSWICYFSPTGTSRRVAEAVGRGLNCAQTIVCDATHDAVSVAAERGDAAVFAVPVYGGHAAPLALRRLDAVRGDGTPAVVVVLYGNRAYEHAACELADFVAARGFVPVAAAAFVGEHSYSTARWPIAAGRPDGDDCAEAEAFGRVVAAKLAAGGVRAIDVKRLPTVRNGMLSMWRFVRFVLGYRRSQKRHPQRVAVETSADRCTHCGRCVKLCPTGAIVAGDELRTDAAKCIRCCACVKGCPVGARSYDSPFAPVLSRNFAQRKRNLTLM